MKTKKTKQSSAFEKFATNVSKAAGSTTAFIGAFLIVVAWAVSGPIFDYSETWQLVINTGTTIITFLMVFLIQNTQNRDNDIIHVKLDELIRATKSAEQSVLDLEALDNPEIHKIRKEYQAMGSECDPHHQSPAEHQREDGARDNLQR